MLVKIQEIINKQMMIGFLAILFLFCLHFLGTQIIYSNGDIGLLLVLSFILPFFLFFISDSNALILNLNCGFLTFYYFFILFLIKKYYKKVNEILIHKKYIDSIYFGKDFTYILWDGDLPDIGIWWNKGLASRPSWLDHLFTHLLYLIPLLTFWIINHFFANLPQ